MTGTDGISSLARGGETVVEGDLVSALDLSAPPVGVVSGERDRCASAVIDRTEEHDASSTSIVMSLLLPFDGLWFLPPRLSLSVCG